MIRRIRERLGWTRPGDSWSTEDGGTLTYLGKAPDKWKTRECDVCRAPATHYKTLPPWPGSTYAHTSMTCDAHESYLSGHSWAGDGSGNWIDRGKSESRCCNCNEPYGTCDHTRALAAQYNAWEAQAERGLIMSGG